MFGETCRLENVNLETMNSLEVEIDTKSLKYVFFDNSKVESFTEEFIEQLKGVEFLNANDVGLERVDGRSLRKLEELMIFWGGLNQIKRLEADSFSGNRKLEEIYLKFNKISFIDEAAFKNLYQLLILDLSSNKLNSLNLIFKSLKSLIHLDLSSNLIDKLPENVFKNLIKLKSLKLQKNNLKSLNPVVFEPLKSLEFIDVSFNKSPIKVIPGDLFKQNINLQQIYFVSSKIQSIDRNFFQHSKPSLEVLSLRTNECIDDDLTSVSNGSLSKDDKRKLQKCFDNFYEI